MLLACLAPSSRLPAQPRKRFSSARVILAQGGLAANVALARKLALLFYRLLRFGMHYVEQGLKCYEIKVLETETRLLRKLAKKQGFTLMPSNAN